MRLIGTMRVNMSNRFERVSCIDSYQLEILMKLFLTLFVLVLFSCGENGDEKLVGESVSEQIERGKTLFAMPVSGGNVFACVVCHGLKGEGAFRRPGHPMTGVVGRATYKNGQLDSLPEAINSCLDEWMKAPVWEKDSEDMLALIALLERDGKGSSEEIKFDVVQPPSDLTGGEIEQGRGVFNESCAVCHGVDAVGSPLAPSLSGRTLTLEYIAERTRLSGAPKSEIYEDLTGGIMPFWGKDRLSDKELIDVSAFLVDLKDRVVDPNNQMEPNNGTNNGNERKCEKTHPKIGQELVFQTHFHGVSGKAKIVDNCTIQISGFNYDGNGIDVRFWSGKGTSPDFDGGYALSEDLLKTGGYSNVSYTIQLTEEQSLDDIDGISVWCVAVGISFGDGRFE